MNTFHYFDNIYPSPNAPQQKADHDIIRFLVRDVARGIDGDVLAENSFETIMYQYEQMRAELIGLRNYKTKVKDLLLQIKTSE